jgi:TRAP-type C4-dicarboxylate transport system substrate-binding protein
MKLPVYSRADLSRTVALVGAPCLTAVSTGAVTREFRAATLQALHDMSRTIAERSGGRRPRTKSMMASNPVELSARRFTTQGAQLIYNSVRSFRSIAGINGLRLRVQQSELMSSGVN